MDPNLTKDEKTDELMRGTVAGMAHFAGTGPSGKTCGDCKFLTYINIKGAHARCAMFQKLMGKYGPVDIPSYTLACRHFVASKRER